MRQSETQQQVPALENNDQDSSSENDTEVEDLEGSVCEIILLGVSC